MSHRQEEKQRRREERLAKEADAQRLAARRRRRGWMAGGLALVIVIGIGVAVSMGGGGDSNGPKTAVDPSLPRIPAQQESDLTKAAAAAGCTVTDPVIEGDDHASKTFTASDYRTNPPTSGTHFPTAAQDGIYDRESPPALGESVHSLEHGRILVQYAPRSSVLTERQLETLVTELDGGYHQLLFANTTNMDAAVAATAWGHSITCPRMNNRVFDAFRSFRSRYIDQGPETAP